MDAASQANSNVDMDLTFGERAVGLSLKPSGNTQAYLIKETFAGLIDGLHGQRLDSGDNEVKRMYSIAINEAETACMWAVKAATWGT